MKYRILIPSSIILALLVGYVLGRSSFDKSTHPSSQASVDKTTHPSSQGGGVIKKAPTTNVTEGPGKLSPGPQYSSDNLPPSGVTPPHYEVGAMKPPLRHPSKKHLEAMEDSMRKARVPEKDIARMMESFEGPKNPPVDGSASSPYELTVEEINKLPREQFEEEMRRNFKQAGIPQEDVEPMVRQLTEMHMRKLERQKIPSEPERPQPRPGTSLPSP
jgi:hypothetical protein